MTLKSGNDIVGGRTRLKIVKNKVAPPFKVTEVDLLFGKGVSQEGEIIDLGVSYDIISKTGAWYAYGENKLGQGKEAARQLLEENRALYEELKNKILEKAGLLPIKKKNQDNKTGSPTS